MLPPPQAVAYQPPKGIIKDSKYDEEDEDDNDYEQDAYDDDFDEDEEENFKVNSLKMITYS